MQRITSKLTGVAGAAALFLTSAAAVLAQYDDDYYYDYTYDSTLDSGAGAEWTLVSMAILCCVTILVIAGCAFSIWMLIHAWNHAPEDQKMLWILLMLFVPFMSLVYFFTKKKEWEGGAVKSETKSESPPAESK